MLANLLDGIPYVLTDADRDARFPAPKKNLRVMYSTGEVKRWSGAAWSTLLRAEDDKLPIEYATTTLFGFIADSVADDRAALYTLANVTMQPNGGTIQVVGVPRIASNVSIPSNVTLKFVDGAYLAPDINVVITINGRIKAQMRKIVGGGGSVLLTDKVPTVFPQWWGALGDGVAADKPAFKAASAACPIGGTMRVPRTASFYKIDISGGQSDAILIDKQMTVDFKGVVKSTVGAIQANPPTIFRVTAKEVVFEGDGTIGGDGTINDVNTGTDDTLPSLIRIEADQFTMRGLTIDTPFKVGVYLWGCYNAVLLKNKFTGGPLAYSDTAYFAIRGNQGGNHNLTKNRFYPNAAGGMYVNCIFFNNTNESLVEGNFAKRPYEKLIYCAGSYNTITGNWVLGNPGIVPGTNQSGTIGPCYRLDGIFNKLTNNYSRYGGGAQSLGGRGCDISGNHFLECNSGGISVFDVAVTVNFDYLRVCDNVVTCGNRAISYVGDGILVRPPLGPSKYIRIDRNTVTGFSKTNPLVNTPVWAAATAYPKNSVVKPTVDNTRYYVPLAAGGVSGAVEPIWPAGIGAQIVDGTITWVCTGYDANLYAQIRLAGPAAGQENTDCFILDNLVAEGARGISTDRTTNSSIARNRGTATVWAIVETNGSNIQYGQNPILGAANAGIQGKAASSTVFDYREGFWVPQIEDGAAVPAVMAGTGSNWGRYVRVGRMVTITGNLWTLGMGTIAGGAPIRVAGLPFKLAVTAGDSASAVMGLGLNFALPVAGQSVTFNAVANQLYMDLNKWSAITGTTRLTAAEWGGIGSGGSFSFSFFTDDP